MKTIRIAALALLVGVFSHVNAQYALQTGKMQFNGGIGLSSWGLPLYAGIDYGFDKNISFGGELSFRSFSERVLGERYTSSIIGVAGNANYHFVELLGIDDLFDVYAGLNVGFYVWNTSGDYVGTGATGLGIGAQIGGRYYFKKNMAVNVELGGGNAFSGGKVGLSILLNKD
jgi:outer membrane immunogenic protein